VDVVEQDRKGFCSLSGNGIYFSDCFYKHIFFYFPALFNVNGIPIIFVFFPAVIIIPAFVGIELMTGAVGRKEPVN